MYGSPPLHDDTYALERSSRQLRSTCRESWMSGHAAPRAILMRSLSAAAAACAQHEPQYSGTNWFMSGVAKFVPFTARQSISAGSASRARSVCGSGVLWRPGPPTMTFTERYF